MRSQGTTTDKNNYRELLMCLSTAFAMAEAAWTGRPRVSAACSLRTPLRGTWVELDKKGRGIVPSLSCLQANSLYYLVVKVQFVG